MAQGRLRVTIVEAAQLADKDKTDFNDPYVEVYIDEKNKEKTGVLENAERPVWNETFEFDINPNDKYIHIDAYDKDEGKKDDLIGSAKVNLNDVIKKGSYDDWIKVSGLLGLRKRGDIHVRMSFEKA